jgi:hypothetical protein
MLVVKVCPGSSGPYAFHCHAAPPGQQLGYPADQEPSLAAGNSRNICKINGLANLLPANLDTATLGSGELLIALREGVDCYRLWTDFVSQATACHSWPGNPKDRNRELPDIGIEMRQEYRLPLNPGTSGPAADTDRARRNSRSLLPDQFTLREFARERRVRLLVKFWLIGTELYRKIRAGAHRIC